jgi:hypothetical protein
LDPVDGSYNANNIAGIREFFECMREFPHALLRPFVPDPTDADFDRAFEDILFETDEGERPVLKRFIRRRGPKSLVIPHFNHLFDARNPTVERFAKTALKTFIPIISLADEKLPLTPALMRLWGDDLPFKIMENQRNVQISIMSRFSRIGIRLNEYAERQAVEPQHG